jgi:hypothetical protein
MLTCFGYQKLLYDRLCDSDESILYNFRNIDAYDFWAIMVWLNNTSMFWMSKTCNFDLGQEILTHSVWCSIAISKNNVKMFWLSKTCNLLSSLRGIYQNQKTHYKIFHNVYWSIPVISNNNSMFWMWKTWIFVLVEQFYYLVCDAAKVLIEAM